jgi:predicted  nucleic acid-binding Zn-ribbon protein
MVQDLIRYDADKQALNLLDSNLRMKDNYIAGQEKLINSQLSAMKDMRSMITQYESSETEMLTNIDQLKNDLNKKKSHLRFYQTAAFAAVAGIFINHYMWKFGGK